jgi:hypothetical protein
MSPTDSDAPITKMKDGRTYLAHKAEHAELVLPAYLLESCTLSFMVNELRFLGPFHEG